ncbi:hypothetical protein VHUM_03256 [Vanrija humicola]|uniref:Major facilitator superfamily (MFS) profile domain-containing protein n=1 Tax=Vanrija humicola TaxID=5417 RepID=A0A7D8Z6T7_VANHU|nr:hypothetical protein VHUM_03256 [Vanrija humicola]
MPALAIILGAFASFGGFLFGYDTGYISGCKEMEHFLQSYGDLQPDGTYILSSGTDSLITSILSAGTFVGSLFASTIGDWIGRRMGVVVYLVVFCVGVALQTAAKGNVGTFAAGRVLAGLGVGGTSCLVPIYQAECAPKKIRGIIVSAYQFFITFGLLIAAVVVNGTKNHSGASSYRIPIALQFIWAAILAVGMFILPESPRWLVLKGRTADAKRSLSRLLGAEEEGPDVTAQLDEIEGNLEHERQSGGGTWADCFRQGETKNFQRVATGCIFQALTQLSGINFIFYYGTTFFRHSGISDPFLITIATNVVNVGMTIPGMILTDYLGRRPMVMYGAFGMAVCQIIVAAVGVSISVDNAAGQKVLVAFVCIFIAHFASCYGPLSWVITSELYPYNIRTKGMSLSTASNWLFNFAIGYATPYLVNTGPGNAGLQSNVFWIWGGCCALGVVFAYFMIPETKQLSLEQVDLIYRHSTPRKSVAYRKKIINDNIVEGTTARRLSTYSLGGAEKKASQEVKVESV